MAVPQARAPGMNAGPYPGGRILAPLAAPPSAGKRAKVSEKLGLESSTVLVAARLSDWLQPEGAQHKGLLVQRKPVWTDFQHIIDQGVSRGDIEEMEEIKVQMSKSGGPRDLGQVAEMLLNKVRMTLPEDLQQAIRQDVIEIGEVVAHLCPWSEKLEFKIEVIGESCCSRWHRDNYCARAIVTYNSSATVYSPDDNIDFWELENCGNNKCIIKDPARVVSTDVGDVFFMKGNKFPCGPKGLVHKSPEIQRHYNGMVVNRLVLKVDVP